MKITSLLRKDPTANNKFLTKNREQEENSGGRWKFSLCIPLMMNSITATVLLREILQTQPQCMAVSPKFLHDNVPQDMSHNSKCNCGILMMDDEPMMDTDQQVQMDVEKNLPHCQISTSTVWQYLAIDLAATSTSLQLYELYVYDLYTTCPAIFKYYICLICF